VLFIIAIVEGLASPVLAVGGVVPVAPPVGAQVVGLAVALAGFAATLAAQTGMGASWRICVDPGSAPSS
jgi:hypothetical protein